MLILSDAGILLRVVGRRDPQKTVVRQTVRRHRQAGDVLVTSLQSVAEFWNVSTRPATAWGGLGLTLAETQRRLRIVERLIQVLPDPPGMYAVWKQLVIQYAVMGVRVHDARLVAWMQAQGIRHILTLNAADFGRYQGITVITP
jgi:predicted nucleic acid-binding protein